MDSAMDELTEEGTELYSHHGVLIQDLNHNRDDDSLCSGTLYIKKYTYGTFIEWIQIEEKPLSVESQDQGWAMVNTVKTRPPNPSDAVDSVPPTRKRPIKIDIKDLKSYRISDQSHVLTFMLNDGSRPSPFLFQNDNADKFVASLQQYVTVIRSSKEKNLYSIVGLHDEKLTKSFAELDISLQGTINSGWKFLGSFHNNPYETTMTAFSKVAGIVSASTSRHPHIFRKSDKSTSRRRYKSRLSTASPQESSSERIAASEVQRGVQALGVENTVEDMARQLLQLRMSTLDAAAAGIEEYEVITSPPLEGLPPRPTVKRGPPLSLEEWANHFDENGRIINIQDLKAKIFRGGIAHVIRFEAWKFLLDYMPPDATRKEWQELRKNKVEEYFKMKLQWESLTQDQETRFSYFRERKNLIEKDVNRTDRTIPYFEGNNNPHVQLMYDILMTYVMYNFDLGYVQGMSDLLSPILYLMENEVDAFWCFVGFMNKMSNNFEMDQSGMKQQLKHLNILIRVTDPELGNYLEENESDNLFFCFRWLLILFKREFSYQDIMTLWEVLWTELPGPNFHLFICLAILDTERDVLIGNQYGFTEILKHVNDLSLHINLEDILAKAEAIYLQLMAVEDLPDPVKVILNLAPSLNENSIESEDEIVSPSTSQQTPDNKTDVEIPKCNCLAPSEKLYEDSLSFQM